MVYVLNNTTIHDDERYKQYLCGFMATFEPFGGKVLAVQNAPSPVEGSGPYDRTALLALPSRDVFDQWVKSDAYQAIVADRHAATVSNVVFLDGFASWPARRFRRQMRRCDRLMSAHTLHQALLAALALSALAFALAVAGRLGWCSIQALRSAKAALAAWSIAGMLFLAASLGAVVVVWLAYGVAHSQKDLWTDLWVSAITLLPFHGACYGLWRMGRRIQDRIASRAA